ncbi:MAG: hypothetical protein R3E95_20990 [Thiolinea sp.]
MVSTSLDGQVRLYDARLTLLHKHNTQGGSRPFFARFSPDGKQIAVGFDDSTAVEILSGEDLQPVRRPESQGIDANVASVAWSQDGRRLYAGGLFADGNGRPLVVWDQGGAGQRSLRRAAQNTVMDIKPLRDGGVVVASGDPALVRLDANGQVVWKQTSGVLSLGLYKTFNRDFALDKNGTTVGFHFAREAEKSQAVWQLADLQLGKPSAKSTLSVPRHEANGLNITDWENEYTPKLNGQPLPLQDYERSRSLAINAQGDSFALGTEWSVRLYEQDGALRWQQSVPLAWAVNISADDRWVVAALGDGTIRWYEKANGRERLAFYLHPDEQRWVAWTPEGFYAAAPGAEDLIGYHLNRGADREAEFVGVDQLRSVFSRADLVAKARWTPTTQHYATGAGGRGRCVTFARAPAAAARHHHWRRPATPVTAARLRIWRQQARRPQRLRAGRIPPQRRSGQRRRRAPAQRPPARRSTGGIAARFRCATAKIASK